MKYELSHIYFAFLCYVFISSASSIDNDSFSKKHHTNASTYVLSSSIFVTHTNSINLANKDTEFYDDEKWQFNLSISQRKCLNDVLYILRNINCDWAVKSEFFLFHMLFEIFY